MGVGILSRFDEDLFDFCKKSVQNKQTNIFRVSCGHKGGNNSSKRCFGSARYKDQTPRNELTTRIPPPGLLFLLPFLADSFPVPWIARADDDVDETGFIRNALPLSSVTVVTRARVSLLPDF